MIFNPFNELLKSIIWFEKADCVSVGNKPALTTLRLLLPPTLWSPTSLPLLSLSGKALRTLRFAAFSRLLKSSNCVFRLPISLVRLL